MTELRHRRPDLWREGVNRIFALLERHGEACVLDTLVQAGSVFETIWRSGRRREPSTWATPASLGGGKR
jgi:hypothetical protein